jgi:hypothetical protein
MKRFVVVRMVLKGSIMEPNNFGLEMRHWQNRLPVILRIGSSKRQ